MSNFNTKLHAHYFQIVDIWNRLCMEHTNLFETTCEEYAELLEDDIDNLEQILIKKEKIILHINALDSLRANTIKDIEAEVGKKINNVHELMVIMSEFEEYKNQQHIYRFNQLLIDIIEKIQSQNKKNQLFLNKASMALQEIKDEVLGQKTYSTYSSKGIASGRSVNKSVGD